MSLEQLSKTVDFVQDTTPSASDVNDGETYLDTSQSPPQLKVFDGSASTFIRPRSIQNLDAPVSGAGATQTDIETGVDNSTTASTVSNNLDSKVSNAGQGVEWSNKTPEIDITASSPFTVTGSGYLVSLKPSGSESFNLTLTIDGTQIAANIDCDDGDEITFGFFRFNSSFELSQFGGELTISYVLD